MKSLLSLSSGTNILLNTPSCEFSTKPETHQIFYEIQPKSSDLRQETKFSKMTDFEISFKKLRPDANAEEVNALVQMAQSTFSDTFRHYKKSDLDAYLTEALSSEALSQELKDNKNYFYFVYKNQTRVGFLKGVFPSDIYLDHLQLPHERPFLLQRFYFLPEYCGQGIAPIALEFVQSLAKYQLKADYLYLSVWEKNYRAQNFYQKHGFRTLGSFDYPVGQEIDHEFLYGKKIC